MFALPVPTSHWKQLRQLFLAPKPFYLIRFPMIPMRM
jgi:hypothetical protein